MNTSSKYRRFKRKQKCIGKSLSPSPFKSSLDAKFPCSFRKIIATLILIGLHMRIPSLFITPVEFIATALNVFAGQARKNGKYYGVCAIPQQLKVLPPRFGHSRAQYTVILPKKEIYKGIRHSNIKRCGVTTLRNSAGLPMGVIRRIAVSTNSRQLDILIQLDFFEQYGNAKELATINGHFDFYKSGAMKTVKKEKIPSPDIEEIIARHATDKNAKGHPPPKSYTITDMDGSS